MSAARFSPRSEPERFGLGGYSLALRRCALLMASGLLSDNCRTPLCGIKVARTRSRSLDHLVGAGEQRRRNGETEYLGDPPPLKWSDLRYVFDIQEDCNGKEAIQATSTRGVRACIRRVAGCAMPTGSAGHAGATANLKLTFHLDHSVGDDHLHVQGSGGNHLAGGNQCD